MLNNEFRLIGTVVSDYNQVGSKDYPKYEFNLEVEKKAKGRTAVYKVVVLGTNKTVDVGKSLKGKRIIAQGYIDSYKDFMSLVLQDHEIIGGGEEVVAEVEEALQESPLSKAYTDDDEEDLPLQDLPDDDLPF